MLAADEVAILILLIKGEKMKKLKVALCWILALSLFCGFMFAIQHHDNKQENVCKEKGMVIVRPFQGKAYCSVGTRDGL